MTHHFTFCLWLHNKRNFIDTIYHLSYKMKYFWHCTLKCPITSTRFGVRMIFGKVCNYAAQFVTLLEFLFGYLPMSQLFFVVFILWSLREVYFLIRKCLSKCHRELEKFNGPMAFPVIGTVADMIFSDFWKWSNGMCKKWGDPLRLWKFGHPMVFISTYEYAIQLLSNNRFNGKLKDLEMLYRQPGGSGLSTTPGDVHPSKRRMLNPAFSRQIVEGSVTIFSEESIGLLERLEIHTKLRDEFDMVELAKHCLFRMVVRSDFGDMFMKTTNETDVLKHVQALETIANNMSKRMFDPYPWLKSDLMYFHFTSAGKETSQAADVLNGFATRAIQGRRHFRSKLTQFDPDSKSESQEKCYLDILLDLVDQGQMTDEDVISELNNFMGGAYDTTALTISWTLLLLALNPKCQEKCYEELEEIFGTASPHPIIITASETKRMKYLELCLKESLRLFPPAPVFPRSTVTDIKFDDGRIIPGGVDVLIFANLIHRDPKHFPEPDQFIPERHLENHAAYMPFSLGVRNCIGQVYGMYQSKVVLAYLCRAFLWETNIRDADAVKIKYQGLLYPKDGLHFKISKRVRT